MCKKKKKKELTVLLYLVSLTQRSARTYFILQHFEFFVSRNPSHRPGVDKDKDKDRDREEEEERQAAERQEEGRIRRLPPRQRRRSPRRHYLRLPLVSLPRLLCWTGWVQRKDWRARNGF